MAKKKTDLMSGLTTMTDAMGKVVGVPLYKETPQVKGRISRALAKETPKGTGKIAKRPSYRRDMRMGLKQSTKAEKSRIVHALAKATKRGKGLITKRPAYKKYVR